MIIFLYGSDTYRSRQKLNEIIAHYRKVRKSGLNLKFFDGQSLDFQDLKNEIQINPMFKEKKFLILKNIFQNQNLKEKFLKNYKIFLNPDAIVLIYEEREILPQDPLFRLLKREARCQEFKPLEGLRLRNWIKKEIEKYEAGFEPKAIDLLIEFVGNDLWRLNNEIQKLVSFKKGSPFAKASADKQKIEAKDVKLLVRPKIETSIFKTIDFIALKNKKRALEQIHKHLERGDSPLYLLSMINFQFRNILEIGDLIERRIPYHQISKKLNLHPLLFRKSYFLAKRFTKEELKKIYQKIFEVDLAIKIGKIEPETALNLLIAEI